MAPNLLECGIPVEAEHGEVLGPASGPARVVVVVDEEEGVGAALQVRHRQQSPFQSDEDGGRTGGIRDISLAAYCLLLTAKG